MDVSLIVARLIAECPTLEQVITAKTGGTQAPVASQANLYALLGGLVDSRMYPLTAPESPTHPSMVYQMVSSTPGTFEGYDVTHTDVFIINIRDDNYDDLMTLSTSVINALSAENIEVTDVLHDYVQADNLYRINLELSYSYITSASQALPAAFVYPIARTGAESSYDNYTKQLVSADYAVLIISDDGNVPALLDEVQSALLGWQQSIDHHEMQYNSGSAIEGVGGMEVWRESYADGYYMEQT